MFNILKKEEEEEVQENKISFANGESIEMDDFDGIATYENILFQCGKRLADKYWEEKIIKIKWNIFFREE